MNDNEIKQYIADINKKLTSAGCEFVIAGETASGSKFNSGNCSSKVFSSIIKKLLTDFTKVIGVINGPQN